MIFSRYVLSECIIVVLVTTILYWLQLAKLDPSKQHNKYVILKKCWNVKTQLNMVTRHRKPDILFRLFSVVTTTIRNIMAVHARTHEHTFAFIQLLGTTKPLNKI